MIRDMSHFTEKEDIGKVSAAFDPSALWTSTRQGWLSSPAPGKSLRTTTTNKYVLRTFCVPGTVLGPGSTAVNKDLCHHGTHIQ